MTFDKKVPMELIAMLAMTLGFGAILVAIGVYSGYRWFVRRGWESLEGEVISVRQSSGSDGFTYQPVIRVMAEGQAHEFESSVGSYPAPKIGVKRRVIRDPVTGQFDEFNFGIFVLTVLAPIVLGFGLAFLGWTTFHTNKQPSNKTAHPTPLPAASRSLREGE